MGEEHSPGDTAPSAHRLIYCVVGVRNGEGGDAEGGGKKKGKTKRRTKKNSLSLLTIKPAKAPIGSSKSTSSAVPPASSDVRQRRRAEQAPTPAADVRDAVVGAQVQPVMQQVGGAVRQQRVALHLAEADAAAGLAALDGLARQRVHGPDGADLELVGDLEE